MEKLPITVTLEYWIQSDLQFCVVMYYSSSAPIRLIITNDIHSLERKACEQIATHSAAEQHSNLNVQVPFGWENTQADLCVCKNTSMLIRHAKRKAVAVLCETMNYSKSTDQ